jgi:hypothetical protein
MFLKRVMFLMVSILSSGYIIYFSSYLSLFKQFKQY